MLRKTIVSLYIPSQGFSMIIINTAICIILKWMQEHI